VKRNVEPLTAESRRWRTGLLIACGVALVLVIYDAFLGTPLLPICGDVGFSDEPASASAAVGITGVSPGGPAARVGVRVGDRIDLRDLPFRERWSLNPPDWGSACVQVGRPLQYLVHRGMQTFSAVIVPASHASWGAITDWLILIPYLWALLFAALLAIRRPDLVQARLLSLILIIRFGGSFTNSLLPWWPIADFVVVWLGGWVPFGGAGLLSILLFATFGRPLSPLRRVLTGAAVGLVLLYAVRFRIIYPAFFVFALPVVWLTRPGLSWIGILGVVSCAIAALVASQGSERPRLLWIILAFAPPWLFEIIANVLHILGNNGPLWQNYNSLLAAVSVWTPVGLTYAILSRRCIDVGYVINRAIVFAGVSIVVLGVFVLVEWALSTWIVSASHTTSIVVNIAVALALGLSLRFVHRWVERFVDRVFFRKRHDDEVALRRFAKEAAFITNRETLLDRTATEISQHADASCVNVDLLSNGALENDPAVLALRAWHRPVDLHQYDTELKGGMAFPLVARGNVVGVLSCGEKRSGEAYAPDELDALESVAHGVGTALVALQAHNGEAHGTLLEAVTQLQRTQTEMQRTQKELLDAVLALAKRVTLESVPDDFS
jgi:hypothetical protein